MASKHKYRIVIELEASEPVSEELLEDTAFAACVQVETLEEETGIGVAASCKVEAMPGTCTCRQYANTGSCDHL